MKTGKSFDYDQALGDPCRIFGEPDNVLSHPDLGAKQKREILEMRCGCPNPKGRTWAAAKSPC